MRDRCRGMVQLYDHERAVTISCAPANSAFGALVQNTGYVTRFARCLCIALR